MIQSVHEEKGVEFHFGRDEELVYALYRSSTAIGDETPTPAGTVEEFARGRLWIAASQDHFFET
jgi:hypothetical protein